MPETLSHLISRLCSTYSKPLDEGLIQSYTEALAEVDLSILSLAVKEAIAESQWMPKPSELLSAAKRIRAESSTTPAEPAHHKLDSYSCSICRDTGYVTIWSGQATQWALKHVLSGYKTKRQGVTECAARCNCPAGDRRPDHSGRYREGIDVLVQPVAGQARFAGLLDWAKERAGR